jgi:hypothetical protein
LIKQAKLFHQTWKWIFFLFAGKNNELDLKALKKLF